jgi:hypothetical protein
MTRGFVDKFVYKTQVLSTEKMRSAGFEPASRNLFQVHVFLLDTSYQAQYFWTNIAFSNPEYYILFINSGYKDQTFSKDI